MFTLNSYFSREIFLKDNTKSTSQNLGNPCKKPAHKTKKKTTYSTRDAESRTLCVIVNLSCRYSRIRVYHTWTNQIALFKLPNSTSVCTITTSSSFSWAAGGLGGGPLFFMPITPPGAAPRSCRSLDRCIDIFFCPSRSCVRLCDCVIMTSAALRRAGTSVEIVLRDATSFVRDCEPYTREFSTRVQQNPWTLWGEGGGKEKGKER